jgi:hypothetical protein
MIIVIDRLYNSKLDNLELDLKKDLVLTKRLIFYLKETTRSNLRGKTYK